MFDEKKRMEARQDRLMAFFDAILAIAMTVLALEITVPQLGHISWHMRYDFFVQLTCYLISFVALSTLWYVHNNFFSNHDISQNVEIVLHLVLLFVITLFQPLTRAIGQHPADRGIRIVYLADFIVMYGLLSFIFMAIRRKEKFLNERREARHVQQSDQREKFSDEDESEEVKHLRKLFEIVIAVHSPDRIQERLAEYMPDEYAAEYEHVRKVREESYHLSICSVLSMGIAIFVAVICLMFSIWLSYIALIAGMLAVFLIRMHGRKIYGKDDTNEA